MTDSPQSKEPGDLGLLLDQLQARAQELPAEHRGTALDLVGKLKTEFASKAPDGPTVKAHVSRLSSFVSLVPLLETIATRLAGTGM